MPPAPTSPQRSGGSSAHSAGALDVIDRTINAVGPRRHPPAHGVFDGGHGRASNAPGMAGCVRWRAPTGVDRTRHRGVGAMGTLH